MKTYLWGFAAVALVAVGPTLAADIQYKPIDTNNLVVRPTNVAAGLASKTINMVGRTAAGSLEGNGYVKTINNLLGKKVRIPTVQAGKSPLPGPNTFSSNYYKSYNKPLMPTTQMRQR